ncbi:MAG: adenylyltransferase/cytidyltransferase family protein [Desulfovibrionaceae bacterium]
MNSPYALGVIHGRFQVLHNDHLAYLKAGKALCDHLIVGITNPDPTHTAHDPADPKRSRPDANPLTYYERAVMVRAVLAEAGVPQNAFTITPLPINKPELIHYYVPMDAVFFLTIYDDWGRAKQRTFQQLGLATHILWERAPHEKGISAEDVRARMLAGEAWQHLVPPCVPWLVEEWKLPQRLAALRQREE